MRKTTSSATRSCAGTRERMTLIPYTCFRYEPGKEYSTDFVIYPGQGTEFGFINEGLHSFMSLLDAVNEAKDAERWVVCEFTIPVGSKYYENDKQGHYCSDRIRFDGLYHKNFWSKVKEYFRNLSIR